MTFEWIYLLWRVILYIQISVDFYKGLKLQSFRNNLPNGNYGFSVHFKCIIFLKGLSIHLTNRKNLEKRIGMIVKVIRGRCLFWSYFLYLTEKWESNGIYLEQYRVFSISIITFYTCRDKEENCAEYVGPYNINLMVDV
jgi:hypothetical protein